MSKKFCVYTCITGDYDNLHEIKHPEKNIDYYCFTNNKNLKSKTWKIIQIENEGLDNQRLSRKIKMLGHPIISKNHDISIWMDASISWDKNISDFVKIYLKNKPFAAFKHSQRKSIQEEAVACLKYHKDTKENIVHTLDFLKAENFPDNLGLYEMTVFIKKHNDPKVIETMNLWFNVNSKYSKRDQLSFTYAIWKTGLIPSTIKANVWDNSWFHANTHLKSAPVKYCYIYYGDSSQNFSFDKYYRYEYQYKDGRYLTTFTIPLDINQIEISPINTINILYDNIKIEPLPLSISPPISIEYDGGSILYSEDDAFKIKGNFKEKQKLSFSFDARTLNQSELYKIIQQQKTQNLSKQNLIDQLQIDCNHLLDDNQKIAQMLNESNRQLQDIINSKSWRLMRKIKNLLPPY